MTTQDKLADALRVLIEHCTVSDDSCYGTLSTSFVRKIAEEALAEHDAQPAQELWCMHILGPDDVHPAPSKVAAEAAAERFNAHFGPISERSGVMCKAVAAPWPHSMESHAESLDEWSQWEQPAPAPVQVDAKRCDGCGQTPCRWSVPCGRRAQRRAEQAAWKAAHPPAPAADGAGELPLTTGEAERVGELPALPKMLAEYNPQSEFDSVQLYTSDQMRAYARAAIAALRQPVALREVTMEDMANACDAYRREQPASNDLAHPKAMFAALRAILPHGIPAIDSQQESRND